MTGFLALSMLATSFTGCAGGTGSTASGSTNSEGKTTVEFWTISLQPNFTKFLNGLINQYESSHKNVTVKWTDLPADSIQQKLITSVAGGTAPDVVNLNTQMALQLAGQNALVDLNKEATADQKSIYVDSIYSATKMGDSVYAFPWYVSPNILMYNKDLFQKAGLTKVPATFDEANEMAKTMKEKTGAYLYVPDSLSRIMFAEDYKMLSADKTKVAFNNDGMIQLLNKYKTLTQAGYLPKEKWGDWDNALKLFETGKLAIINDSGSSLKRIKEEAPDVYKKIAVEKPMGGKAGVYTAFMNLVVPVASKNHKEAIAFANYMTNDDNQLAFCKQVSIFPSTKKASKDSYFTADTTTLEGKARDIAATNADRYIQKTLGLKKEQDVINDINKVYEATIMGNTDPKQAVTNAESQINTILSTK